MKKDRSSGLFLRGKGHSRLPAKIVSSFAQRAAVPSPLQMRTHVLCWQEPSLHLTCPPRTRLGGERLYTLLRPTACQGGEGHAVARGDCRRHAGSQDPAASSRKPEVCTTPLPTPVQEWVASAYILSCAPLLVRGERATQWRGGDCRRHTDSRKPR